MLIITWLSVSIVQGWSTIVLGGHKISLENQWQVCVLRLKVNLWDCGFPGSELTCPALVALNRDYVLIPSPLFKLYISITLSPFGITPSAQGYELTLLFKTRMTR